MPLSSVYDFERSIIREAIFEKSGRKLPQTVSNLTLRFMKNAFQMAAIDFTQMSLIARQMHESENYYDKQ